MAGFFFHKEFKEPTGEMLIPKKMDAASAKATLEAWSDAPILLLAGFLRQSEPDYSLLSLVTAVVNKPFEIETLRATMEHLAA